VLESLPLSRKQVESVATSEASVNIWDGAIRSGKTIASLLRWLIYVASAPRGGELVMIGRTREAIGRNIMGPLQDPMLFGDMADLVKYTTGAPTGTILGRKVHVIGASDAKAEKVIRGMTVAGAYCDEITVLPEDFFTQLLGRMSVEGAQLFGTTNPDSPSHWLKVKFLDKLHQLPHWRYWKFTMDDNPALSEDYKARKRVEFTGLWKRRFIEGLWVAAEGAVYPMWDVDRHVTPWETLPPLQRLFAAGIDYGTTNASSVLLLGLTREAGMRGGDRSRLVLVDEWRHDPRTGAPRLTDGQLSERVRGWLEGQHHPVARDLAPEYVVVDPSAASFRVQLQRDGVTSTPADNDVTRGISLTATLLAEGQLVVSDRCHGFISEVAGYSWDPKATEKGEDKPLKVADHSCFIAGTPVLTAAGERPIETIRPGDRVLTRDGWKPAEASGLTGTSEKVHRVELSNGQAFTGTGNHPIWVAGKGWIRLDALRYADKMVTWESVSKSSFSTESSSADTQKPEVFPSSVTTRPESGTDSEASSVSTKRSGCTPTGSESRRGITSTTPTETTTTTSLPTSCASPLTSTWPTTVRNPAVKPSSDTGSTTSPAPSHGTGPKLVERGIPSTESRLGRGGRPFPSPAISAQRSTKPGLGIQEIVSARTPASPRGGETLDSTTRLEAVSSASPSSPSTGTAELDSAAVHVLRVTELPDEAPVWNLSVADCPEYFAAGVLVHNCDASRYALATTEALWRPLLPDPIALAS